jgi:hypothetical protein
MKRQRNVQQQNNITETSLRYEATHWRENLLPEALRKCAHAKNVVLSESIILELDIDFPGMPNIFGLLLTHDERFVRFAIDSDPTHCELVDIDQWEDVTAEQNINARNRGVGSGYGAIALKILRELNGK